MHDIDILELNTVDLDFSRLPLRNSNSLPVPPEAIMPNIKVFSGSSHQDLAQKIVDRLGKPSVKTSSLPQCHSAIDWSLFSKGFKLSIEFSRLKNPECQ